MTGIFQKDTSFSATEAQGNYQTLTMYTGDPDLRPEDLIGYSVYYDNGCSIEPKYIEYDGGQYNIVLLGYLPTYDVIFLQLYMNLAESVILNINGKTVTLKYDMDNQGYVSDTSAYQFEYGETYVIKVISIS